MNHVSVHTIHLRFEVSDPSHSSYGQYLSDDQVHALVRPSEKTLEGVEAWLEDFGISSSTLQYSPAQDWIKFNTTVRTVEDLLRTKYYVYENDDGSTVVRTEEWSLPVALHKHITTIQPTNSFARLNGRRKPTHEVGRRSAHSIGGRSTNVIKVEDGWPCPSPISYPGPQYSPGPNLSPVPTPNLSPVPAPNPPVLAADPSQVASVCNFSSVTPLCLRTLYGTLSYTPQVPGANKMGLTNYLEEYCNRSDTSIFLSTYRPEAASAAYEFTEVSIAGGYLDNGTNTADADTGVEGDLDVQTMLGISWPTPLTTYNTGGRDPTFMPDGQTTENTDEPFLDWANYLTSQPIDAIPQVISTSYGDDEQTISKAYAETVCNQFAQLGAKGVSLLFASGDFGVGPTGYCLSNRDNTTRKFLPAFPASCPYVTTVGGTTSFPETAAYDTFSDGSVYTSGAGFSEYFPQ